MATIERVHPKRQDEALKHLVGGRRWDISSQARIEAIRQYLQGRRPETVHLWWARSWRRCCAAALVVQNPGRIGLLLHSPAGGEGVDADGLGATISAATGESHRAGLTVVQSLENLGADVDVKALLAAGYQQLAELEYMRLELSTYVAPQPRQGVSWRRYGEFTHDELADVIRATYEHSLDCPLISGVREMDDVIDAHRASGSFHPASWWIADVNAQPAGCLLVNDMPGTASSELVYLGVAPKHRGAGLSTEMIHHAAADAAHRGQPALTLAVDTQNHYARTVYTRCGFKVTHSRLAYVSVDPKLQMRV